jgi:hypothetical protein
MFFRGVETTNQIIIYVSRRLCSCPPKTSTWSSVLFRRIGSVKLPGRPSYDRYRHKFYQVLVERCGNIPSYSLCLEHLRIYIYIYIFKIIYVHYTYTVHVKTYLYIYYIHVHTWSYFLNSPTVFRTEICHDKPASEQQSSQPLKKSSQWSVNRIPRLGLQGNWKENHQKQSERTALILKNP